MEIHEHIFESLREPRHVRNAEKRMPAADAKTSTDLLQVLKILEHNSCRKQKRRQRVRRPQQCCYMLYQSQECNFCKTKTCGRWEDLTKPYKHSKSIHRIKIIQNHIRLKDINRNPITELSIHCSQFLHNCIAWAQEPWSRCTMHVHSEEKRASYSIT